MMAGEHREHILFLTGRLAQQQLENILQSMQPTEFTYETRNIGISVAALMTAGMISRRVTDLHGADRIIVPGLCLGDLAATSEKLGVPCIRGTVDMKDLPAFFGRDCKPPDLSRYRVDIFAEITDAPNMTIDAILARAGKYAGDGANIIDIGCLPDTPFPHLEETVTALHEAGFTVSVDSLAEEELLRGGRAGAEYLLSLSEDTLWIGEEAGAIPVLIPARHGDMPSLYRAIEKYATGDKSFFADPILDPIHFGFTESILRYRELRQSCPDVQIIMGIGNITELTEADTTGINAILFGIISELALDAVLATEVSPHCRSVVREADMARRMMYAARSEGSLPKGFDASLTGLHARKPLRYTPEEINEIYRQVKDPSYRIQLSEAGAHVYNRDGIHTGADPFELFPALALIQDDAPHAFYMGVELARAQIAWQLGKAYMQDEELDWGSAGSKTHPPGLERDADRHKAAGSTLAQSRGKRKK